LQPEDPELQCVFIAFFGGFLDDADFLFVNIFSCFPFFIFTPTGSFLACFLGGFEIGD